MCPMRLISLAVLSLLVFSTIPLVHVSPYAEASEPGIMALDVCNTSGSAVYAGIDLPYLCESPGKPFPERSPVLHERAAFSLTSSLLTFQGERPPESWAIFRICL